MGRKIYISFKTEDAAYKDEILSMPNLDYVDKSLHEALNSEDEDYIMQRIRSEYLYDSTVTIFLIGRRSAENLGYNEQRFIKRELQGSLYSSAQHSKNGILGVVLPEMTSMIYRGQYTCPICNGVHNHVFLNDSTVIKEFSYNYYIPNGKCSHMEEERYCVLAPWEDFRQRPEQYIEAAFAKRTAAIASKVKVRP